MVNAKNLSTADKRESVSDCYLGLAEGNDSHAKEKQQLSATEKHLGENGEVAAIDFTLWFIYILLTYSCFALILQARGFGVLGF